MPEDLTPMDAARAFAAATRWEKGLVQRTEGLTWMTWGTVTAGILMTLGFLARSDVPAPVMVTGWSSWVLIGFAFTFAIWRSAALVRPDIPGPAWYGYPLKAVIIVAAILLLHYVVRPETLAAPMVFIGIGWGGAALFVRRSSRRGRWIMGLSAVVIVSSAFALELLALSMTSTMLIGTGILAGAPLLGGLYQTLRG